MYTLNVKYVNINSNIRLLQSCISVYLNYNLYVIIYMLMY